jgi:hypothetical protein
MTTLPAALISTHWLADHLGAPGLTVLDASLHLPAAARDAADEFAAAHIPGARFLGLASLFDATSPVPYAFPTPQQLAERLAMAAQDLGAIWPLRLPIHARVTGSPAPARATMPRETEDERRATPV